MSITRADIKVLVACEFSGTVRNAFLELGYNAASCDILPGSGVHFEGDVKDIEWSRYNFDLLIGHPPCTYFSFAANGWGHDFVNSPERIKARMESLDFVKYLWSLPIPHIALENPRGMLSQLFFKETQVIQPYHHGHPVSKATCLWLKNLNPLAPTDIVKPEFVMVNSGSESKPEYKLPKSHGLPQWARRSLTFPNVAKAMAEQWGQWVLASKRVESGDW